MRHFKATAAWAKTFMILAILAFFVSFSLIGAVAEAFPSLQEWSKRVFDWLATTVDGWGGVLLPESHEWLYANVKVGSALIGLICLTVACVLYSIALRGAGKAASHRPSNASQTASTVVIGSSTESRKLMKEQAKEAERNEKMRKLEEIKAEKLAKKAAKKAAKAAAKAAKEEVAEETQPAKEEAIAKVAETVQTAKTANAAAAKSMDDILNSIK